MSQIQFGSFDVFKMPHLLHLRKGNENTKIAARWISRGDVKTNYLHTG